MRRAWRWIAGVALALVLLAAAAALALPGWVKTVLEERGRTVLGREVRVGAVEFSALELAFTAREVQVSGAGSAAAAPQLTVGRLYLQASIASLWHAVSSRAPVIEAVEIDALALRLARIAPGELDIDDIVQRLRPKPDAARGEPPRFRLRNVKVARGAVSFDDRITGRRIEATEIELRLPRLSRLGGDDDETVESSLSLRLQGAPVALAVRSRPFSAERTTEASLRIQALDLVPWWVLAEAGVPRPPPLRLAKGTLDLDLTAQGAWPAGQPMRWTLRGRGALADVVVATPSGQPLAAFRRLEVPVDELRLHDRYLALGAVRLQAAQIDARRDAQGRLELAALATGAGAPAAAEPAESAESAASSPWQASVSRIDVVDALVRLDDAATRPASAYRLEAVQASAERWQWPAAEPVAVTLEARLADAGGAAGTLHAEGTVGPRKASVRVEIADLRLDAAAPYLRDLLQPRVGGRVHAQGSVDWEAGDAPRLAAQLERVQVDGLAVTEPGQRQAALQARAVVVEKLGLDLQARRVEVATVRVQAPALRVEREADGTLRMQRWLLPGAAGAGTPRPAAATPAWRWSVGRAEVDGAQLHWVDHLQRADAPVELKAGVDRLSLQGLAMPARAPVRVELAARLHPGPDANAPPGRIAARGQLRLAPLAWRGTIEAERLPVHALEPYYAAQLPVRLRRAELGLRGEADLLLEPAGPRLDARGELRLADLQVDAVATDADVAAGDTLLAWEVLTLQSVAVSVAPGQRPRIEIDQARVDRLDSRLVVTERGRFNLTEGLGRRGAPREPAPAPAPEPEPERGRLPVDLVIGSTTLVDARIDFHDYYIRPNFSADLTELNGKVGRISSLSPQMATIELRGRAAGTALLEIRGALNPAVNPPVMDLSARATDLELAPLSPYAAKYAGYGIERGKLSVDLAYRIEPDGRLDAKNQVILNQLTFGEKVDSPSATKLPVRLALALLSDRNGVVDVELPVSGSISDPQFSLWGIVLKVIGNLIVKAVTAPFALLTGSAGPEQNWIEFVAGTATVAPAGAAVVDKVAQALVDRPGLRMTVVGSADAVIEREAMQAAAFEARVLAEQRRELARAGSPIAPGRPAPALAPAERERLVRRLYAETPLPDKPRNVLGLVRELPLAETEGLLRRHVTVSSDTARELAIQRALAVRDALVAQGLASERLFVGAPRVGATAEDDAAHLAGCTPRVALTLDGPR